MSSPPDASSQLKRPSLLRMISRGRSTSTATNTGNSTNNTDEVLLTLQDLPTPSFVINRHAFAQNCQRVLDLAQERGLSLRPHIKTHKTLEGIVLQCTGGTNAITGFVASTLPEVKLLVNYYTRRTSTHSSDNNIHIDILYGVPLSETKLPALWALQDRLVQWHSQWQEYTQAGAASTEKKHQPVAPAKIGLLIDHMDQIAMVQRFFQKQQQENQNQNSDQNHQFPVMVKLDTGYHRAGVTCDQKGVELVEAIVNAPCLKLVGVYSHCGHAYDEPDQAKLDSIANTDMDQIQSFLQQLEEHWDDDQKQQIFGNGFTISVGSTPSLLHHYNPQSNYWTDFFQRYPTAILEIHPGNYTLYDRQQLYTQACPNVDAIAGRVLTRVIGHYNDPHRPHTILMDAGATALTKETTPQGGWAAITGYDDVDVYKMSQEVSMARANNNNNNNNSNTLLEQCPLGSLLTLLPNHSCLAAACFEKYYIIDDPSCQFAPNTPIVEEWEPVKGW